MEYKIVCTLLLRLSLPLSSHATASQALILPLYVQGLKLFLVSKSHNVLGQ